MLRRRPSNPPLIANAGFESTLRPRLTLIIHNLTKEFLRSSVRSQTSRHFLCYFAVIRGNAFTSGFPRFPQMGANCAVWYHTLALRRNYHILPVRRDTAIWPGRTISRTTTDNTRIFTRFQFNWRHWPTTFGGILHVPNWRPFEFFSGQIFVFIDTEFVKILEIGILFFFCRHRNPILWYEISSCKMCSIRRNIKLQKHKPDYIRIWNRTNWSKT